jgi:hypothetical protein
MSIWGRAQRARHRSAPALTRHGSDLPVRRRRASRNVRRAGRTETTDRRAARRSSRQRRPPAPHPQSARPDPRYVITCNMYACCACRETTDVPSHRLTGAGATWWANIPGLQPSLECGRPRGSAHWWSRGSARWRARAAAAIAVGDGGCREQPHFDDAPSSLWPRIIGDALSDTHPGHARGLPRD